MLVKRGLERISSCVSLPRHCCMWPSCSRLATLWRLWSLFSYVSSCRHFFCSPCRPNALKIGERVPVDHAIGLTAWLFQRGALLSFVELSSRGRCLFAALSFPSGYCGRLFHPVSLDLLARGRRGD